jgi:hypothetical protein
MAIVMSVDRHRAQITAEWVDTETAQTRALKGRKKRPKTDRVDARHREHQRHRRVSLEVHDVGRDGDGTVVTAEPEAMDSTDRATSAS